VTARAPVQKLWNYCNILRDDVLSYGDYVEVRAARALTYPLFLKMADEHSRPPFNPPSPDGVRRAGNPSRIPKSFDWDVLVKLDSDDLEPHDRHTLDPLGKCPGILGVTFRPPLTPRVRVNTFPA